jgi:hypothetical protein
LPWSHSSSFHPYFHAFSLFPKAFLGAHPCASFVWAQGEGRSDAHLKTRFHVQMLWQTASSLLPTILISWLWALFRVRFGYGD